MYYQCIAFFPVLYNKLHARRGNRGVLAKLLAGLALFNAGLLLSFWYGVKASGGYRHFDSGTGKINFGNADFAELAADEREDAKVHNATVLGFYLFAPFWYTYFVAGVCAAFLYDAHRPAESHCRRMWGRVADAVTVAMLAVSIAHIVQGARPHGGGTGADNRPSVLSLDGYAMRPVEADTYVGNMATTRLWDSIYARLFALVTTLWIFALSTGEGTTAWLLRSRFLVETLSPTAYSCFLFHQMVAQWYYAATRSQWWDWWRFRKTQYWFSQPVPGRVVRVLHRRGADGHLFQAGGTDGASASRCTPPSQGLDHRRCPCHA